MPELPTGTVTLFFTDLEGSTRLLQHLGGRYAEVLAQMRRLLRSVFAEWQGHEVDTQGDAFFVVFARATDAVAAAAAVGGTRTTQRPAGKGPQAPAAPARATRQPARRSR